MDKAVIISLAVIVGIAILWVLFHVLAILCKYLLPIAAIVAFVLLTAKGIRWFTGA